MKRALLALAAAGAVAACHSSSGTPLPEMIDVKAGSFLMGAPADADAQQGKPQHQVTIRAFRLGATEVTFDQYDAFANATKRPLPQDDGLGRGARPVINIDRGDMLAYIDWLNRTSGHTGYRLPSEAEWEYAARAGTTTDFYWGNEPDPDKANTRTNKGSDHFAFTSPARTFPANPWGFYDMAGNVWEMTADCLFADYAGAPVDGSPHVEPGCAIHMVRGGDYSSSKRGQKPTARAAAGDHFRSGSLGFRVAQDGSAE
ncbi:MAG: SUMF1/EgtB/PvdO family nonheme iron enzyme [Novosphingobium sp.]|nr:SUMF1/EgtB/PvdO family nonheme iron enzyme [Novosphingobium sp.]